MRVSFCVCGALQDLKPSNIAVNEDCELKVCIRSLLYSAALFPESVTYPQGGPKIYHMRTSSLVLFSVCSELLGSAAAVMS